MFSPHTDRAARWVQWVAAVVAVVCLGWATYATVAAFAFDRDARRDVERSEARADPPPASLRHGDVIGILDIPRLGFSEIVAEGDTDDILRVAIGHLPDTPLPWQPGKSAIAGHRDGHFRPLKDIKAGDRIHLRGKHGSWEYVVERTLIVLPTDLSVLAPTRERYLTLITCYPFSFVGKAPKRFVIHARAVAGG